MKLSDLNGKTVCILGFGREGKAVLQALEKHAPTAEIAIADRNASLDKSEMALAGYPLQLENKWLSHLEQFDVVIKSPGIPPCAELDAVGAKLTNSTQLFLDSVKDTGALVVGVTGSKGKSTTSSLIAHILKAAGKDVPLLGNIGVPSIAYVEQAAPGKIFVLEMSSYQLADLTTSPNVAVMTSFFPEHLDYHGSLEKYYEAKTHIAKFQTPNDTVFFNALFPECERLAGMSPGKAVPFSAADAPLRIEETKLIGTHNVSNIAAAWKVAESLGVSKDVAVAAIKTFDGLPHRLQSLVVHHGAEWVDDAISTTPESTIAALDALGDRVRVIMLGGQDRGYDFATLGKRIAASSISDVILFPGSGPAIREAIEAAGANVLFHEANSMADAVATAVRAVTTAVDTCESHVSTGRTPPAIVLLSTASPSYGMFKNFEDKGDQFASNIKNK